MLKLEDFRRIHLQETASTNADAEAMADRTEFAIITAERQTAGRTARAGGEWRHPRGNLAYTMLVRSERLSGRDFPTLSLICGLSVAEAVESFGGGVEVKIKWPNDLLVARKKACGILIERAGGSAIIGVGLNVRESPPAAAAVYPTTSLLEEGIDTTAAEVAERLSARLVANINAGFAAARAQAARFLYRLGEKVYLDAAGGAVEGVFEGLAESGGIVVDGKVYLAGQMTKENF